MRKPVKIFPSLLAADFAHLADEVARVEASIDGLHIDVMDGHFVPNVAIGLPVIESLRKVTRLFFDAHLMMTNPDTFFEDLKRVGVDLVTVHVEVFPDPTGAAARARQAGLDFGIVMNPPTPFGAVEPFLELCDLVLVMSVMPGFGGQAFIPEVLPKIEAVRKSIDSHGLSADIQVDGGVTRETGPLARSAGADVFVAGSAIFRAADPIAAVNELRASLESVG